MYNAFHFGSAGQTEVPFCGKMRIETAVSSGHAYRTTRRQTNSRSVKSRTG